MKPLLTALVIGLALLTGCATRQYVVTLNNGYRIMAAEKPHLEGFNFVFADLNGRTNAISSTRVRSIVPASSPTTAK